MQILSFYYIQCDASSSIDSDTSSYEDDSQSGEDTEDEDNVRQKILVNQEHDKNISNNMAFFISDQSW